MSESKMFANVLVIRPNTMSAADKELLRTDGVVCVESSDPEAVRFLVPTASPLDSNELLFAAIRALSDCSYSEGKVNFVDNLAAAMAAKKVP